jgi:nucleoid-associated protein YgaU
MIRRAARSGKAFLARHVRFSADFPLLSSQPIIACRLFRRAASGRKPKMSKEKIVGLSVIGVLTATLAGVGGWRMMGGKATSAEPAAIVAVESDQAVDAAETVIEPTVLASATSTGSDPVFDQLAGKTKIAGGWGASSQSSAPVDPSLPDGTHSLTQSESAPYDAVEKASEQNRVSRDRERHPSYMPRETAETASPEENRYSAESMPESTAVSGELAESSTSEEYGNEASREVPHELAPDSSGVENLQAAVSSPQPGDVAGNYRVSQPEAVQIVEPSPLAAAQLTQQVERDPAAEQLATRAADDARFAQAYAKEREAVRISEAALEPRPTSSYAANEVPQADATGSASPDARFVGNSRFTSDSRFTTDARYAPAEENVQMAEASPEQVTPTEAALPEASRANPPRTAYNESVPPTDAYRSEPSYRDSVYREPGAVSEVGSAPLARNGQEPASDLGSGAIEESATPAAPYADATQAVAPYGTATRATSVSVGSLASRPTEKHVPPRENTGKYYVEPGDSMWTISQKIYGTGGYFKALQEHNRARFLAPSYLQVGDEVLTPSVAELRELYSGLCPKVRLAKPGSPAAMQASHLPVSHAGSVRQYEVQAGDTLFDIARYELGDAKRWPEIYQLNRVALGADIDYVKPGTKLLLPMDASLESEPTHGEDVLTRQPQGTLQR